MEADYPHTNAAIGGEGEHNQKKSVMKRVKDKAKKIKDTIKKHGGRDHEEQDDEDEETVNASEIPGAPLNESSVISGTSLPKQTGLDLEKPADPPEASNLTAEVNTLAGDGRGATKTTGVVDSLRNEVYGSKNPGVCDEMYDSNTRDEFRPEDRITKIPDLQNEHHQSKDEMDLKSPVKIGPLEDLEEGPHCPTEKIHPSKVVDPTGQVGKEADVSPLAERLGNLHVNDESGPEQRPLTGSHDQFSPESDDIPTSKNPKSPKSLDPAPEQRPLTGSRDQFSPESDDIPPSKIPESPKSLDPAQEQRPLTGSHDQFSPESDDIPPSKNPESPKRLDPAPEQRPLTGSRDQFSPESDDIPPSKNPESPKSLDPAPEQRPLTGSHDQFSPESDDIPPSKNPESPKRLDPARPESMPGDTFAGKISSAIADNAVSAKNAVASKLGYGEAGAAAGGGGGESDSPARPESMPGDTFAGKIADNAVSAKNAVTSKLGYGEAGAAAGGGGGESLDPARPESMPGDTFAGKISSAIADNAVSAKNAVASKLGYGEAGAAAGGGGGGESDKGVSMKELSPGEEDRALSEAITRKPEDPGGENTGSGAGVVGRVKGWLGMGSQTVDQDSQSGPGGGVTNPAGGLQ